MVDLARYEMRRRMRGTLALSVGIGLFALLVIAIYPSIEESGAALETFIENLPASMQESFGLEAAAYTTIEGFLATEVYQFIWLLLLALYVAYVAGATIAGDVETGRMDLILAAPVSRTRVLGEKFLALFGPILAVNLVMPVFVFAGAVAVGESMDVSDLVAVHVLSVPYLLVCAGIGLLLSVLVSRADFAQRGAIAAVFFLFVLETVTVGTDFEWMGVLSPTRYYDPSEILVEGTYDVAGAVVLLSAALVLVMASETIFRSADI